MHRLVGDDPLQHVGRAFPADGPQHQEAAVEPRLEEVPQVEVHAPQVGLLPREAQEVGAHRHQLGRGARHAVEPARELLARGLGRRHHRTVGVARALRAVGRDGRPQRVGIEVERVGDVAERPAAPVLVQRLVAIEDQPGQRHAAHLVARRQERLAQLGQAAGVVAARAGVAPLEERGKQVGQEGHSLAPITRSGSPVARAGKRHSSTMATTMQPTKGSDPMRIERSGMSGAMPLMT